MNVFIGTVLALAAITLALPGSASAAASLLPTSLTCESRTNPLGIDAPRPLLGWKLTVSDRAARGARQTAYRILAASSPALLSKNKGDLWDTGRVASGQTSQIAYGGKPLHAAQGCWWAVHVWDENNNPSTWSAPASWTMGLPAPPDWHGARWIGAPLALAAGDNSTVLLRREFPIQHGLKRALVFVCGLGQYELTLNGHAPTNTLLSPGWTNYRKTCLYDTYDVTGQMRTGPNAIGLLLGNGMYRVAKGGRYAKFTGSFGPLKAIALVRLEYGDGSVQTVSTDGRWSAGPSPMTFSSVYGGEDWDAGKVQSGWDSPGFAGGARWMPALVLDGPGGVLRGTHRAAPPLAAFEVHRPVSQHELRPGAVVYDLGQTASHMARFTAHGPAGSVVRITPSELLQPNGTLFRNNYNGRAWNNYTLSGRGRETYAAKFYYGGCRYYQVECLPAPGGTELPQIDAIEGIVVHSSAPSVGEFACSNSLFNKIFTMIRWAEVSNMMSVITDCPHRERLGWLEQDHLHGPSFRYNFDMSALTGKIVGDMTDSQDANGLVPTTAPEYMSMTPHWRDAIEWGSSAVLLPMQEYQWTGNLGTLRQNFPLMQHYVDYLTTQAKNGLAAPGLGDWSGQRASPDTPKPLVATALYYADAVTVARAARLLGRTSEADAGDALAAHIHEAFNAAYFHADTNQYGSGSQCANAMALALGLAEPARRAAVLANIVTDLETRHYELTVGEVGLEYLFQALAQGGRSDVVYAMNNQSDRPGYGYQLKMGATALCETWDAVRDNSQAQFMLGHIMEWFYHDLAGIQPDPDAPGFSHCVIRPAIVGDLTEAKASYNSVRGTIRSEWTRANGTVHLYVSIPANCTATVFVPTDTPDALTEDGKPISESVGVTMGHSVPGYTVCTVGSGDYAFAAPLAGK